LQCQQRYKCNPKNFSTTPSPLLTPTTPSPNTGINSQIPVPLPEEIDKYIVKFFNTAKQLESLFAKLQTQSSDKSQNLKKEIVQLQAELENKNNVLNKYVGKIQEWENTFNNIKEAQKQLFDSEN